MARERQHRNAAVFFFDQDRLIEKTGTMQPKPKPDMLPTSRQVTVSVPREEAEDIGILTRIWRWMGLGKQDPE